MSMILEYLPPIDTAAGSEFPADGPKSLSSAFLVHRTALDQPCHDLRSWIEWTEVDLEPLIGPPWGRLM